MLCLHTVLYLWADGLASLFKVINRLIKISQKGLFDVIP